MTSSGGSRPSDNGAGDIVPRCNCAIDAEEGEQEPYDAKQLQSSCNCLTASPWLESAETRISAN